MADTCEETFIPLLHRIDGEKMQTLAKKIRKEQKQREGRELQGQSGETKLANPVVSGQKDAPWIKK